MRFSGVLVVSNQGGAAPPCGPWWKHLKVAGCSSACTTCVNSPQPSCVSTLFFSHLLMAFHFPSPTPSRLPLLSCASDCLHLSVPPTLLPPSSSLCGFVCCCAASLKMFPRMRNRLKDRDKVKSLFRRSMCKKDSGLVCLVSSSTANGIIPSQSLLLLLFGHLTRALVGFALIVSQGCFVFWGVFLQAEFKQSHACVTTSAFYHYYVELFCRFKCPAIIFVSPLESPFVFHFQIAKTFLENSTFVMSQSAPVVLPALGKHIPAWC